MRYDLDDEELNLTDTQTGRINFDLCLDAQETDCLGWRSDQAGTMIVEKHGPGPAEMTTGQVWPEIESLPVSNNSRWSFKDDHLNIA